MFLLLLSLLLTQLVTSQNNCSLATNCKDCTTASKFPNCGYCHALGQCLAGSSSGPSTGTCPAGQWAWSSSNCCWDAKNGDDCTNSALYSPCGWCQSSQQCLQGSSSGPTGATCPPGYWAYSKSNQCWNAQNGNDCTNSALFSPCGWCNQSISGGYIDGDHCIQGTSSGPVAPYTCPSGFWAYTKTAQCWNAQNGKDCTNSNLYSPCGWCNKPISGYLNNVYCIQGSSNGPVSPYTCPAGYWAWKSSELCWDAVNCSLCTNANSYAPCGWCSGSGNPVCVQGSSSGPTDKSLICPAYAWSSSSCPVRD